MEKSGTESEFLKVAAWAAKFLQGKKAPPAHKCAPSLTFSGEICHCLITGHARTFTKFRILLLINSINSFVIRRTAIKLPALEVFAGADEASSGMPTASPSHNQIESGIARRQIRLRVFIRILCRNSHLHFVFEADWGCAFPSLINTHRRVPSF